VSGILNRLKAGEVLISDGGTGTYLQGKGLRQGDPPEAWNLSYPDLIQGMAADYFAAGSDAVETNSFGCNPFVLEKHGLGERLEELNRLAAAHARKAAPPGCFVIGSVGPTGELLEPIGAVSVEAMYEGFVRQVKALADGGADAICAETMTSLEEACLAVKAAKAYTSLPVMATMTFDRGPRGNATMMGVTPEDAVRGLLEAGADVIGSNCGNGVLYMVEIAAQMRKVTDAPILIHANAGIPSVQGGKTVFPETPDWMAPHYRALVDAGAGLVGGCCGTTPDHIRAIARVLRG
jgi:5-methyltetrahydrofolate--homocysteine methyltransferase